MADLQMEPHQPCTGRHSDGEDHHRACHTGHRMGGVVVGSHLHAREEASGARIRHGHSSHGVREESAHGNGHEGYNPWVGLVCHSHQLADMGGHGEESGNGMDPWAHGPPWGVESI